MAGRKKSRASRKKKKAASAPKEEQRQQAKAEAAETAAEAHPSSPDETEAGPTNDDAAFTADDEPSPAPEEDAPGHIGGEAKPTPTLDPRLHRIRKRTARVERIRHLVILDAQTLARRFAAQVPAMIDLFSRHRDRDPLLAPLRSWLPSAAFGDLAELEPEEQLALSRFLEELEALRWYCRYTDDMPNTAQAKLDHFSEQLNAAAAHLAAAIRSKNSK